jgi:hypothetical protein
MIHLAMLLPTCYRWPADADFTVIINESSLHCSSVFVLLSFLKEKNRTSETGTFFWVWLCVSISTFQKFYRVIRKSGKSIMPLEDTPRPYVRTSCVNNNSIAYVRTTEVGASRSEMMCGNNLGQMCDFWHGNMFTKYEVQQSGRESILTSLRFDVGNQSTRNLVPMRTIYIHVKQEILFLNQQ